MRSIIREQTGITVSSHNLNRIATPGQSANKFQEEMAVAIGQYSNGKMSLNDFRAELYDKNVKIDADMDKLLRKHEAGDTQSYAEFGKRIYRQMNG